MTYPSFASQSEAEQYAAEHGIKLTAADRDSFRKAQEAELTRLMSLDRRDQGSRATRLIEGFNRLYPRFLESMIGLGDILLTFTQTVIVSFGVPMVLALLLVVEQ